MLCANLKEKNATKMEQLYKSLKHIFMICTNRRDGRKKDRKKRKEHKVAADKLEHLSMRLETSEPTDLTYNEKTR